MSLKQLLQERIERTKDGTQNKSKDKVLIYPMSIRMNPILGLCSNSYHKRLSFCQLISTKLGLIQLRPFTNISRSNKVHSKAIENKVL